MKDNSYFMTVLGAVSLDKIGITLPHEHFFLDWRFLKPKESWTEEPISMKNLHNLKIDYTQITDNLYLNSESVAISELAQFKELGGSCIVDVSSIGTGRSPRKIKKISQESKVHIVMGTGYYLKQFLDKKIQNDNEENLLKLLVQECQSGYKKTGIRPGVIGEIGVGPEIGEWERKSLKVAALLQQETNMAISVHIQAVPVVANFKEPNGIAAVSLLEKYGANLEKVIIGHTDAKINLAYMSALLKMGVNIEFDHFGKSFYFLETNFQMSSDYERVLTISELVANNFTKQILISTDICLKTDLVTYGGHGYAHILRSIVPMLARNGLSEKDIKMLTIENPKRIFSIESKYV